MREGASLRELLVGDDGFVSPATGVTVKVVDGELVVADPVVRAALQLNSPGDDPR